MQEPILSLDEISGRLDNSKLSIFEIVSKFKFSGFKSLTCALISLILPSLSKTPGFSFPFCPTLNTVSYTHLRAHETS